MEAAAGFGKSVLGQELAATWGAVPITVQLERTEVSAALFIARLRAAVAAAGYTDAAAVAVESGEDAVGALDAMLSALAAERCAFIVDDAHEAAPDAAALLGRMAGGLSPSQRLVVLGRRLPVGAAGILGVGHVALDGSDLSLTDEETREVCREGFHLDAPLEVAGALRRATGGWTAATVFSASRVARTGTPVEELVPTTPSRGDDADAIVRILGDAIASMGPDAAHSLAQLARLPLLNADVVDRALGTQGLFAMALARGVPFTPTGTGWWELPNVARERLVALAPADPEVLRRAADVYARHHEVRAAIDLLVIAGQHRAAAGVLADAPYVTEVMDVVEIMDLLESLPDEALDEHPMGLIHASRSLRVAARFDESNALLDRVRHLAELAGDAALGRAARAERAHDHLRLTEQAEAQVVAREVLAAAGPNEVLTRTRALGALGMSLCWQLDASGRRRDEQALEEASSAFARATRLYRELSMPVAAAATIPYWAVSIEFARGRASRALEMLEEAVAEAAGSPRRWAYVHLFRALVAVDLGLDDKCTDSVDEALRVATQLGSDLLFGLSYWRLGILNSYRGDADATLSSVRRAEAHRGTWWGPASGDFLAEAADLLDRVGLATIAREYLERVRAEPKDAGHLVAMAAGALEARHGDPERAVELLAAAADTRIDPREQWRVTLLTAYARYRSGEHREAGSLAARAFEQAAALDQPQLPLIKESAVTSELLGLALETGQPAAHALEVASVPRRLALLGRFELRSGGRLVPLGTGQEARLLKLVALRGRLHAEVAITKLWPDVDPDTGRNRLRTVLNRLRSMAGDVVVRDGESLALAADVHVDLDGMRKDADRARALAASEPRLAASVARGAVARYLGELLPDDRYEDWVDAPREHARRIALELLEQCADEATTRGDLDEVRRLVQRSIEVDPYDDALYLRATTLLVDQGRTAEALSLLRRARAAMEEIGLVAPHALDALEASLQP